MRHRENFDRRPGGDASMPPYGSDTGRLLHLPVGQAGETF
jgi:hypothetical protein